ncbi:centriolar satellite-associated tubulin polyglutamylase complex regulator 1-like [Antedon mediterranea]|uniref:centriolar satellite-associated tubulin polyglutamylase complex regulator 1-like n=1 Tax=Antedon mediterranea TaxID=105859 RepID=UPI003AF65A41
MALRSTDRFVLSAEEYLDKNQILVYVEDAVHQLLELKEENSKINISKFFTEYFQSVQSGTHTLYREFEFIQKTSHNRASFIHTFWKCYKYIGRNGDLLNVREYHSLLCILCANFPLEVVQRTARIMEDALNSLMSFADFLFAFQIQFYYCEFLIECSSVYQRLLNTTMSPREAVVVPSESSSPKQQQRPAAVESHADGIDANMFLDALKHACQSVNYSHPAVTCLDDILSSSKRVSFYGFLMALAKSQPVNAEIGILPARADISDDIVFNENQLKR